MRTALALCSFLDSEGQRPFSGAVSLLQIALGCVAAFPLLVAPMAFAQSPMPDDFNPVVSGNSYPEVEALAVQSDGMILIGGLFEEVGSVRREQVARIYPDGSVDPSFYLGADLDVKSLAVQEDGKILLAGWFGSVGGQTRSRLARFNYDGTLDQAFDPSVYFTLCSMALQADSKILVGGEFTVLCGAIRTNIGRLSVYGSPDEFNPGAVGAGALVYSLAVQPDDRILVGGNFTTLAEQTRTNIGRLNPDGSLDTNFYASANGKYAGVYALAVQPDGKILVGGQFANLSGLSCTNLGRLNADGTPDQTFRPAPNSSVFALALQADGKIIIGGYFTSLDGQLRNHIARVNPDGSVDSDFDPGASGGIDSKVSSLALQADGKLLVGGSFTTLGGQPRTNLGRLNSTAPAVQQFDFDQNGMTWTRLGTSPEIWRTSFDATTNGTTWFALGAGTRISDAWRLVNVPVPPNAAVRGRGFVVGSHQSSTWYVETIVGTPFITSQPSNQIHRAGATCTFAVRTIGGPATEFQWRKNGENLSPSANISGVTSNTLLISDLRGGDTAEYSVLVTNLYGTATSQVAVLTVRDPIIEVEPRDQTVVPGSNAIFSVLALGTLPLSYQWFKDSTPLQDATNSSLTLSSVQAERNSGAYQVVISNVFGAITSSIARLTVNLAFADGFNLRVNNSVYAMAIQTDGKILLGGAFTDLGGQFHPYLGRISAEGTVDTQFPWSANGAVFCLSVQPDGKKLIAGSFTSFGWTTRSKLIRLNSDDALDQAFVPSVDNFVTCLAVQSDGRIVVGGSFTSLGGYQRFCLGRLHPNGYIDTTFGAQVGGFGYPYLLVNCLALQPDGKILVGGAFTLLGGYPRTLLGRLNMDGTLDQVFAPPTLGNGGVFCLLVQTDGRILLGGHFSTMTGRPHGNLVRLNADGTFDNTFDPAPDADVLSLALQTDGKIVVGGSFTSLAGQPRSHIGRLNPDGTADLTFDPGCGGPIQALALQNDGKILGAGNFLSFGGVTRNGIARLNNTTECSQQLFWNGSAVNWLRGGASPEVCSALFDSTTNGIDWVDLGPVQRIPRGWQLALPFEPTNTVIRARGFITGGRFNSSGWFAQQFLSLNQREAPLLSSPAFQGVSPFSFDINAADSQIVVVEVSTNLLSWVPISTNNVSAPSLHFTDRRSLVVRPAQFYRVRLWP